jgi:hypothetical protein
MAKNILNMVLWHPRMKINQAKISYINRGAPGNLKTIKGSFIDRLENGFLILNDGTQIPFHRIIKIEYNDKTLYIR